MESVRTIDVVINVYNNQPVSWLEQLACAEGPWKNTPKSTYMGTDISASVVAQAPHFEIRPETIPPFYIRTSSRKGEIRFVIPPERRAMDVLQKKLRRKKEENKKIVPS